MYLNYIKINDFENQEMCQQDHAIFPIYSVFLVQKDGSELCECFWDVTTTLLMQFETFKFTKAPTTGTVTIVKHKNDQSNGTIWSSCELAIEYRYSIACIENAAKFPATK